MPSVIFCFYNVVQISLPVGEESGVAFLQFYLRIYTILIKMLNSVHARILYTIISTINETSKTCLSTVSAVLWQFWFKVMSTLPQSVRVTVATASHICAIRETLHRKKSVICGKIEYELNSNHSNDVYTQLTNSWQYTKASTLFYFKNTTIIQTRLEWQWKIQSPLSTTVELPTKPPLLPPLSFSARFVSLLSSNHIWKLVVIYICRYIY